jgi:hypothetical protein
VSRIIPTDAELLLANEPESGSSRFDSARFGLFNAELDRLPARISQKRH